MTSPTQQLPQNGQTPSQYGGQWPAQPQVVPASPEKQRKAKAWWQLELTRSKLKREELMNLSRQLASFMQAGVSILDALAIVAEDDAPKRLRSLVAAISADLRAGRTFSAALAQHKDFPDFYVSMIRSAEMSGRLDVVLEELAHYLERDLEARRKIKSALTYPVIVFVLAIAAVFVLVGYVLPKFQEFFSDLGAELPLVTRILLGIADIVSTFAVLGLASFALIGLALVLFLRTETGKLTRDRVLLKLPALGIVIRYTVVERFCRILAAMVNAGVPMPEAVGISAESTANRVYIKGIGEARDAMVQGAGLAAPIAATGLFPAGANQMIRVGEATGTLDTQLMTAATFYEKELNYRLKRLTDVFEPAIIVFVGAMVGFVAIALVSAMYGIFEQVQV